MVCAIKYRPYAGHNQQLFRSLQAAQERKKKMVLYFRDFLDIVTIGQVRFTGQGGASGVWTRFYSG